MTTFKKTSEINLGTSTNLIEKAIERNEIFFLIENEKGISIYNEIDGCVYTSCKNDVEADEWFAEEKKQVEFPKRFWEDTAFMEAHYPILIK